MTSRFSPGAGRKSPAKAKAVSPSEDGNSSISSFAQGDDGPIGGGDGRSLIGRKILQRLGDNTIISGHVKEYNPPLDGKAETWTLHYENPHTDEDEDNDDDEEEVNRAELDKLLNLQAVKEREFPQTPSKKGRGRPKKNATKNSKSKSKTSPARSAAAAAAASPKRSAGGGGSSKKRSVSPSPPSSQDSGGPKKSKKKKKKKSAKDDSDKLRGDERDLGKRIAKEFTPGVYTGEVVEVKPANARGFLWHIDYEDGDHEDLNEEEMKRHMFTYKLLSNKFQEAKGRAVTAADLAAVGLKDDDIDPTEIESQDTPKKKGKGKGKGRARSAQEKLVGTGVRKFFPKYDEFYDGKVAKYMPPDSDDEYADLWHIEYEDGDREDMDAEELAGAMADYKKRYALAKKRVTLPTNALFAGQPATNLSHKPAKITLYGETPAGPRGIFGTIEGYRRYKDMHPSS